MTMTLMGQGSYSDKSDVDSFYESDHSSPDHGRSKEIKKNRNASRGKGEKTSPLARDFDDESDSYSFGPSKSSRSNDIARLFTDAELEHYLLQNKDVLDRVNQIRAKKEQESRQAYGTADKVL